MFPSYFYFQLYRYPNIGISVFYCNFTVDTLSKVLIKFRMTEIPGKQDVKCEKCGWYYVYHVNPNHSCEQNRLDSMLLSVKYEKTFVEGKFEFKCGNCKHYFED